MSKSFYYSTDDALLRKAFTDILNCLGIHFTKVKKDFKKQIVPPTSVTETTDGENNNIRKPMMILPYASDKRCTLIQSLKKNLQRHLQFTSNYT